MHLSNKERAGYVLLALLLLCIAGLFGYRSSRTVSAAPSLPLNALKDRNKPVEAETIVVHVAGAVRRPGVYKISAGSRANDAVKAAGGPQDDADLDQTNLAAKLGDGEQIRIAKKGEHLLASNGGKLSKGAIGPVSLNSATLEDLKQLPGIGPSTAQKILDYRVQHGGFTSIEELRKVGGIGEKKLEKLRAGLHL